ncbi:MAG: hypothetical protein GKR89_27185 [Candidatus Latescibacteria bacterium]|nr:hypothetical protein [Candidatus Latescibacterota bacterium]
MHPAGLLLLASLILGGCATVRQLAQVKRPDLRLQQVRVTGLGFDAVDLDFAIEVDNTNPLAIDLAGLDYDLAFDGHSLLQGRQNQPLQVAANSQSVVHLPLTVQYADLFAAVKSLADNDSTAYQLQCGLAFDLPVLGATRIPFSHQGSLPTLHKPRIGLSGLQVDGLSLTGAKLGLDISLDNPNPFDLILRALDYDLNIDGRSWAQGTTPEAITLPARDKGVIRLPIQLNLLQLGKGGRDLLQNRKPLNYHLSGRLELGSSLPLLPNASLPLDRSGQLDWGD